MFAKQYRMPATLDRLWARSMSTKQYREGLPKRRLRETLELEVDGLRYTATIGRFPDGSVGEIFLRCHKRNSAADKNARAGATLFNIALRLGCDLETFRRALRRDNCPLAALLDRLSMQAALDRLCER
jgi:hypothetical protein